MIFEVAVWAILFGGGIVLAADYRGAADGFLDFMSSLVMGRPNDVLSHRFARVFEAFAAFAGATGLAIVITEALQ
ncbi:hypothetical protein ACFYWP_03620 [Actinacidiphila glaucinigra]|uniref:hypothetical protein n=1 Tax=Actinacidiphila glaucinigra TaxID=235986 RepID=UPI003687FE0F